MTNITITGSGVQGAMIAFRNAYEGKNVILYDLTDEILAIARSKIARWAEYYKSIDKLNEQTAAEMNDRLKYSTDLNEALTDCDLIFECVPEHLSLKQKVWQQYDEIAPPKTLIATNSSSLKVSDIYVNVKRKEKTFAVNHDDPIKNSYAEMMWNPHTSENTKKEAKKYWHELGYEPMITAKEIKGYSLNRTWRAVKKEALMLWANGYTTPQEFDRGWIMQWGTKFGPFKYMDLIGLDTVYHIEMTYYEESGDERDKPPQALKEMLDRGDLGMKSGRGFYDGYDPEMGAIDL